MSAVTITFGLLFFLAACKKKSGNVPPTDCTHPGSTTLIIPQLQMHPNSKRFTLTMAAVLCCWIMLWNKSPGNPLPRFLKEEIIDPLQLTKTAPCTSEAAKDLDLAQGYCPSEAREVVYACSISCATSLISTVLDYLRNSIALAVNTSLSSSSIEDVFAPMVSNDGSVFSNALD
jgi:hypothetical protein